MNLDTLPCEIVTRCFSYLSTKLLISILQLENLPENIFQAVAENCNNLWYSKQIRGANKQRIEGIEAHYETDFDQFLRIREIIEKISPQCPLWFHCTWENIHQMHQTLDEINFVYNNQKLGIHVDLKDSTFRDYPVFSDHDINLKITSLSLDVHFASCIDLNSFPKLETFYGKECEIIVDYAHPSLKNLYLSHGIFITLPVNLKKLVAKDCTIIMNENHPKLEALRELVIEDARAPHNCTLLLQVLWNKNLKTFSCTGLHASDTTEVHSMIGPKVTNLGLDDSHPSTSLPYLVSFDGTDLNNMANFTHVSSLTLRQPWGDINDCQLPPNLSELILESPSGKISSLKFPSNLLKLSITNGKFEDLSNFNFPPGIVDLKIEACDITSASGCLKPSLPARLKRLSLQANSLSSFHAVLPCCEYLSLNYNELTEVQIDAPVLELLDLTKNQLTSIPQLPACLQVLILKENKLAISQLSELPSSLKLLDLSKAEYLALQNYTFPSSVQELYLTEIESLSMSGVKFAKGSRLKELDMSRSRITRIDDSFSYSIDNGMIELPAGLKVLKMQGNYFRNIKRLTIPQTVTFLDLRDNDFKSFKVGTHIETLYLNGNNLKREFVVPNGSELRVLDLTNFGYSFDILRAEKLIQLRLGEEYEVIDISKLPVNFQRGHTGSHETGLPSSSPFDFFRNQYKFSYIRPPRDISRTPNSMNQESPWLFLRNPISEDNMSSHVSQSYLNRFQVSPFLSLRNSTRWRHWQTSNHGVWSPEWFFD